MDLTLELISSSACNRNTKILGMGKLACLGWRKTFNLLLLLSSKNFDWNLIQFFENETDSQISLFSI